LRGFGQHELKELAKAGMGGAQEKNPLKKRLQRFAMLRESR
jgi:hypothetical protein